MRSLEDAIGIVNTTIKGSLPWLDNAFGRTVRMADPDSGIIFPALYVGKGEYDSLMPNENYGNFSFWNVYDPITIDRDNGIDNLRADFSFIVWYNIVNVLGDSVPLKKGDILESVYAAFKSGFAFSNVARIDISQAFEDYKNVYKDYSIDKYALANNQHLIYPYAGVRFTGSIKTIQLCS